MSHTRVIVPPFLLISKLFPFNLPDILVCAITLLWLGISLCNYVGKSFRLGKNDWSDFLSFQVMPL